MKKISLLVVLLLIFTFCFGSFAEGNTTIDFKQAASTFEANNAALKKLANAKRQAQIQYEKTVEDTKDIDPNGISINVMGSNIYIKFNYLTSYYMLRQTELLPEQMKYYADLTDNNEKSVHNTLVTGLRGLYLGLYSAKSDLDIKTRKLEFARKLNTQDAVRLKRGLITELDKEESDYNVFKAQKDVDAAKRSLENARRSFNTLIGVPMETSYDEIQYTEVYNSSILKPVDYYVNKALAERSEILDLQMQIALNEHQKKLLEEHNVYTAYDEGKKDYEDLLPVLDKLKLKLDKKKYEIEQQIRAAYADIVQTGISLQSMENTIKLQKQSFETMKKRYEAGLLTENLLKQTELGISDLELGYKASLYNYNTKIMRIDNAAGIGPAY